MRSLAALLAQAGWQLTGSDAGGGTPLSRDVPIDRGHVPSRIHPGLDLVIFSAAIPDHDAGRCQAARLGIPTRSYPEVLGELMRARRGAAVAGTHGKSTTTAMLADALTVAGSNPGYVFGASRRDGRPGGRWGNGPWMIAEACEYRAHFCHLQPELAVLLGIEADHFDCYRSWNDLEHAFRRFVQGLPHGGCLFYHAQCATSGRLARERRGMSESFGLTPAAQWQAAITGMDRGCYRFTVRHRGATLGDVRLAVPARHNVLNALAAAAAACHAGVSWPDIRAALEAFSGLNRRLEIVADSPQLAIVDDFAHLPAEIAAGLVAVRQCYPGRRLWCVFQPHQVSRTAHLLDELAASLQNADNVIVADIFRAREQAVKAGEVAAADLAARVAAMGAQVVRVQGDWEIPARLLEGLQVGDVLVTMGAGNIGKIAHGIAQQVRKNHTPG